MHCMLGIFVFTKTLEFLLGVWLLITIDNCCLGFIMGSKEMVIQNHSGRRHTIERRNQF